MAKVQSELGGIREYNGSSFEQVLEQVVIDIQEEFDTGV
jgi:Mg2+/Co2+ transporter CorC